MRDCRGTTKLLYSHTPPALPRPREEILSYFPSYQPLPSMKSTLLLKALFISASLAAAILAPAAPLKIGFAQTGAESDWRTANSESMKAEAAKRGIDLKFSDGQGKQENQIRAVRSFITQGV